MASVKVGEWVWRFLAVTLLFIVGWMFWVIYQLNPQPLVMNAAFEASAKAMARANRTATSSVTGMITPSGGSMAPPQGEAPGTPATSAAASPAPAAGPAPAAEPVKPASVVEPAKPAPVVEAATSVPDKPAPVIPVATKPSAEEIIDVVESWARAWSAKDVAAYLAFYAGDFKTPGGESRAAWEASRRQRIGAPKSITISIDAPSVSVVSDDQVRVTFRQGYRSDIIVSSATTKTLVMNRSEGRWRIQQEIAGH